MTELQDVCVLIPTLASAERAPYLLRAIDSLRSQPPVRARIIVVVNGPRCDPALVATLEQMADVRVARVPEADMPGALAAGRALVDTEYFAELDDDDEVMPGALALRARRMAETDCPDAVITNALIRRNGADTLNIADMDAVARSPLRSLLQRNWLVPGAAMFRTATVPVELFAAIPRYLEWTYLGLVLAQTRRLAFLSEPTVIHYVGHPFSVDQSRECLLERPMAFEALLKLDLPVSIKHLLRARRSAAHHAAAEMFCAGSNRRAAWGSHLRSVAGRGGWRYLLYTRYLLGVPRRGMSPSPRTETERT
jgi:glycosyltransferase involved in cell wall biosynthesis